MPSGARRVLAYAGVLATAALALALTLSLEGFSWGTLWVLAVLALVAAIAERQRVLLVQQSESSVSLLPVLFAGVLFGPLPAMVVGATSMMGNFRRPYTKWFVYT